MKKTNIVLLTYCVLLITFLLTSSCKKVDVPGITCSPINYKTIGKEGGVFSVCITSPGNWVATSNETWCILSSKDTTMVSVSGASKDSLKFYVLADNDAFIRSASVTISASGTLPITFVVTQREVLVPTGKK